MVSAALVANIGIAVPAQADSAPYPLPAALPHAVSSSPVDPRAPFTPTVLRILRQLEPAQPDPEHDAAPGAGTTPDQLQNVARLLHGTEAQAPVVGDSVPCNGVGSVYPAQGTKPVLSPLCWADALGISLNAGKQKFRTTAPPIRLGIAASFDPPMANAWGQVEGEEGRRVGVTGIYGPQLDLTRFPNWGRNDPTYGEDPLLGGTMGAAEVNGIQGKGLMSQAKHFAFYNGSAVMYSDARVQDQAAHQLYLTPYEYATSGSRSLPHPGLASSMMCAYQRYQIVAAPGVTGVPAGALGPEGGDQACDNQVMNYVTRGQWGWQGFIASDYRLGMDNTVKSITNGNDEEMPDSVFFGNQLVADVMARVVPLSTFNRAAARVIYQMERFHLLGHANGDSDYLSPSSPIESGGIYPITPSERNQHAATVERAAEEAGVLLKNEGGALPLTPADLRAGVLVLGATAEYMPAAPGAERSTGFAERNAISPLGQLKQFAAAGAKISYLPGPSATASDGRVVPQVVLSTDGTRVGDGLQRTAGPGAPRTDRLLDFTSVSGHGQLKRATSYTWNGYVNVPTSDTYTFHIQYSVPYGTNAGGCGCINDLIGPGGGACTGANAPTFDFASSAGKGQSLSSQSLAATGTTATGNATNPTASGYTERALANCAVTVSGLSAGVHQLRITWATPASLGSDALHQREPGSKLPSLRFGYSLASGDLPITVAAARRARKVVLFIDAAIGGAGGNNGALGSDTVGSLDTATLALIDAVTKVNPNTVVVSNVATPIVMPWLPKVRSVLQMWWPGSEGGTATARLLLGLANPGGHLPMTWPANSNDTVSAYNEEKPLYPGETTGTHPERFTGTPPFVDYSEGIYMGYRYFDREHIAPAFPFGWGLSYTTFRLSRVSSKHSGDGVDVSFDVTNTGTVTGSAVPQLYVGPAPHVPARVQQAERALAGFDRVTLRPGQTLRQTVHIGVGSVRDGHGDPRAFQYWDSPGQRWATTKGCRTIWVGQADKKTELLLAAKGDANAADTGCVTALGSAQPAQPSRASGPLPTTGPGGLPALGAVLMALAFLSRRSPHRSR